MKNKILYKVILSLIIVPFFFMTAYGQQIYFVDNQAAKVQKSDIDGSNLGDLTSSSIGLYGIATDITNGKIYYTNVVTDQIFTSKLDGSVNSVLLDNSDGIDGPRGIAIDGNNNKIYWAESISGSIKKADLDGSNVEEVITGLSSPVDIALDLVNNKIYWSDNGVSQKKISRSDLATISVEEIITGLDQVGGIEVDAEFGKLYWVNFGTTDKVSRANLDGSSVETLVTISLGSPRGIAVDKDNDKIFWSDVVGQSIGRANRDGLSSSTILSTRTHPIGISTNWTQALPVELTTFTLNLIDNAVVLKWETATEVNNYGFEVERQYQGIRNKKQETRSNDEDWEKIGFVEGYGNSNSPKLYSFTDQSIESSGQYLYRLKQIDIDGAFEYSNKVEVDIGYPNNYELKQNYPNPFNPSTTITYSIPNDGQVTLSIYDVLGNEVALLENGNKSAGNYSYNFDASNFSSGLYFYTIKSGQFIETKKMLLIK